jgi:Transposase and inactivated derivatives
MMKKPKFPRLEESYESEMVSRNERLSRATKKLLRQLYLHGLSTGDFQESFRWLFGEDAPLSPSTIVRLKQQWEEEYRQWKRRQLEKEYLYIWADGVYPKGGPVDETLSVLVVLGVNREGRKELLALEEGYRESEQSWADLLRDIKKRGVEWIGLAVADGNTAFHKALRMVYPSAFFQRCWAHKIRNVIDKVPRKAQAEVLEALREIYNAHTLPEAKRLKREFIQRYRYLYPKAVRSLEEGGDALFAYFRFPNAHWKSIKTTNSIESLFFTVKLRTRSARSYEPAYQLSALSSRSSRQVLGD